MTESLIKNRQFCNLNLNKLYKTEVEVKLSMKYFNLRVINYKLINVINFKKAKIWWDRIFLYFLKFKERRLICFILKIILNYYFDDKWSLAWSKMEVMMFLCMKLSLMVVRWLIMRFGNNFEIWSKRDEISLRIISFWSSTKKRKIRNEIWWKYEINYMR